MALRSSTVERMATHTGDGMYEYMYQEWRDARLNVLMDMLYLKC
jgi:hypothetical protein